MIKKGIILAGGHGTRLKPLTNILNKHLIGVYDRPMIDYPLKTLKEAGIKDILIVSGREHAGQFIEYLGSGRDYDLNLTYRVQEEAGGIGEALALGKDFIGKDKLFTVILGDNIYADKMDLSIKDGCGAKVFLKETKNDAERFGIAMLGDLSSGPFPVKKIESIVEKPKGLKEGQIVTGLYVYPSDVFDVVKRIKPSDRGEIEITDVNMYYANMGVLDYQILDGFWTDAGTPKSLAVATQWAIKERDN